MVVAFEPFKPFALEAVRQASRRRQRPVEPFMLAPEAQESIGRQIASGSLSGLQWMLNLLDVPGHAVRKPVYSLVRGRPKPEGEKVWGRDILEALGAPPNRYQGLESFLHPEDLFWDVAGTGVDIALDPLAWATFGTTGAAGKAGQIAARAGLAREIPKVAAKRFGKEVGKRVGGMRLTLGELIEGATKKGAREAAEIAAGGAARLEPLLGRPVGALAGFGPPFMSPWLSVGRGVPGTERLAGAFDWLGGKIRWSPVGRAVHALFDPRLGRTPTWTRVGQEAATEKHYALQEALPETLGKHFDAISAVEKLGLKDPLDQRRLLEMVLEEQEGLMQAVGHRTGQEAAAAFTKLQPEARAILPEVTSVLRADKDAVWRESDELGLFAPWMEGPHWPRFLARVRTRGPRENVIFDFFHPSTKARTETFRDVPRLTLEAMGSDPQLAGPKRIQDIRSAGALIQARYGVQDTSKARNLAAWFSRHELGKAVFGHPLDDYRSYMLYATQRNVAGEHFLQFLTKHAQHLAEADDLVPLPDILVRNNFVVETGILNPKAKTQMYERLRGRGISLGSASEIQNYGLSKELAREATRLMRAYTQPEDLKPLSQFCDSFLQLWKTWQTGPWLAFQSRNRFSGLVNNWIAGSFSPSIEWQTHRLLRQGEAIPNAHLWPAVRRELREMGLEANEQNGLKALQRMAYKHEIISRYHGLGAEPLRDVVGEWEYAVPGRKPMRSLPGMAAEAFRETPARGWLPWEVRGFFGREESLNPFVRLGENMGGYVEGMNRVSPFFKLLKDGWDAASAAAKVKQTQVSYLGRDFTGFEIAWLTRLFPFYKFSSRMANFVARELAEHPGGKLAQFIKMSARVGKGREQVLPEHVAESAAIPVPAGFPLFGPHPGGPKRFITGGGFMHEDPLSFLGGGARRAGLEAASRLTPALKGPLEWITGQSFFQRGPIAGRPLEEMDPLLGRLMSNVRAMGLPAEEARHLEPTPLTPWQRSTDALEAILANSPLSRLLSVGRTITDPRKRWAPDVPAPGPAALLNVLTGLRVADVSEAAQDAILRELAQRRMKRMPGARTFAKVYFTKDELARMDPDARQRAFELQALLQMLEEKGRARARARMGA